ncbi:MAG: argininosuccinate lyase [Verrucomicrobiota bacterium]|nr:argininosuccinate lyase [Verrucomicrobiota bacterium]
MTTKKTIVGSIDREILSFAVGKDPALDLALVEADCLGSAAHVAMLSRIRLKKRLFTPAEVARIKRELLRIMRQARKGAFSISEADQDVHMAVERRLTRALGDLGKRVHTARSRNDQVAVDLRLYGKGQLLGLMDEALDLAEALLALARRHAAVPMVGRTHMQSAMPSSVGLWAASHAESLLDDLTVLKAAYEVNDRCPLGSAAGYGVALALDRGLTARLLGFREPIANVLYASSARGKCESLILAACAQEMLSLSRLAQDLLLYSMPEFGYFSLPVEYGTGSSIMPQKNNPDALELVRAKSAKVIGLAAAAANIVSGLPSGYNRDLQEIKELFLDGLATTRSCLRILARLAARVRVDRAALERGFSAAVFAADRALEHAVGGAPFRDAYARVKAHPKTWRAADAARAVAERPDVKNPGIRVLTARAGRTRGFVKDARARFDRALSRLMGSQR